MGILARKGISKKLRFEIFKRDNFACQYCGARAPEAVLHVDHIKPVSKGGTNDMLNLVAACSGCNHGKGARELSDKSAIEKQRAQLEELSIRREQLEMMLQWRDQSAAAALNIVEEIAERIGQRGGLEPNESGRAIIRKWLRIYSAQEILLAVDEAFDIYMAFDGDEPNDKAWQIAFAKIPGICSVTRQSEDKPWYKRLFYIQGILRRRFKDPNGRYVSTLDEMMHEAPFDVSVLEEQAKLAENWEDFCATIEDLIYGRQV
jgi:hypothetical protein